MLYYIKIKLTFLEVFMLIKQAPLKSVVFATIEIFQIKDLNIKHLSVMTIMMYQPYQYGYFKY